MNHYTNTALPNANSILTNAGKAYQSGDISYIEYLQSVQISLEIERNYLQAIHNFNQTTINLQYLINQ